MGETSEKELEFTDLSICVYMSEKFFYVKHAYKKLSMCFRTASVFVILE